MSTVKDAIDKARSDTQQLHKKIEASAAKNHAALRTELQNAAADAQKIAQSLKTLGEGQRSDAKQHIKDAGTALEQAVSRAKDVAAAADADLKQKNRAMIEKTRDAVQSLSQAVAAKRSTISKN